jgi:sulfur-carrier protein adenylyltransferase/sulfurtransferase
MPNVGMDGQGRLKNSKVLLVGTGGLGSPLAMYLAAAGVGTIGLVDYDVVDESNLHRQVIHGTKDIGKRKTESAKETINDINPFVDVDHPRDALRSDNALEIIEPYDIVIDGTDNFPTRYLVNDACVLLGKPNVYGSIFRFDGQLAVFYAKEGPCYRCMFPEPPPPGMVPSCAEGGVFGVICATIGAGQATEGDQAAHGASASRSSGACRSTTRSRTAGRPSRSTRTPSARCAGRTPPSPSSSTTRSSAASPPTTTSRRGR